MAGYYFIKSNGHLFKLTKNAYRTWIHDSKNRVVYKKNPAKLRNYGIDLGEIAEIKDTGENSELFDVADFIRLDKLLQPEVE